MKDGFARSSTRSAPARGGHRPGVGTPVAPALAAVVALGAGCVDQLPPIEGTSSLRINLVSPVDPGSRDNRLPDGARSLQLSIDALNYQGVVDTSFSGQVDLYVHFLGSLTPSIRSGQSLGLVDVQAGSSAVINVELPPVFGETFLWAEHSRGDHATFATGTTPPLWYRDAFLEDISRPRDESALDALERSPLEAKQVSVSGSRYGARGRLVVTGTYAQGYTLSDVQCADAAGTPPCTTGAYDGLYIFSFSRPEDETHAPVLAGHSVDRVAGAISEFNGLTEVNFPQTFIFDRTTNLSRIPQPTVIDPAWIDTRIELERLESSLIAVEDATLCPLDDDFAIYSQWKLDIGRGCRDAINVISQGQVADFDPSDYVGSVMPRVVGTLRPVNIGSFHVWIMFPRTSNDIVVPN